MKWFKFKRDRCKKYSRIADAYSSGGSHATPGDVLLYIAFCAGIILLLSL